MSAIVIQLQGGLVQDVFIKGTGAPTKAIVVDEDVEDADSEDITTVKGSHEIEGDYEACIHIEPINNLPNGSDVDRIVKEYLKSHDILLPKNKK
jgi:hypothetical protein